MPDSEDDRDEFDRPPDNGRGGGKVVLIVLGVLALLTCVGGAGLVLYRFNVQARIIEEDRQRLEEAQRKEEESRTNPIVVSPTELISAYTANRAEANDRFKNQRLRIEGTVKQIRRRPVGAPMDVVFGEGQAEAMLIVCAFENNLPPGWQKLHIGDAVTVFGLCQGKGGSFGDVKLVECEFINWQVPPPDRPDNKR